MKYSQNYIATAVALVVVGFAFFPSLFQMIEAPSTPTAPRPLTLDLPSPSLALPDFDSQSAAQDAWVTFENYLDAARAHDLATLSSLSHQLSPTCVNPAQLEECFGLMDSVVFFTEGLNQADFKNAASDDKQTVLSTDYLLLQGAENPIKTVLYFTKNLEGAHKVLGLRFCFADASGTDDCVETRPEVRDRNNNGWWDDVEVLFR